MSSPTTEFYNVETTTIGSTILETPPSTTLSSILFGVGGNPLRTVPITTTQMMMTQTNPYEREHLEHNKITFEIPSHRDLEHIDSIHNLNTILKRIGNVVTTYDASQVTGSNRHHQHPHQQHQHTQEQMQQHLLTNAEISKSVVLDLADLRANNDAGFDFGLERFFAGADMHSMINYLWIGVVTSLVILSIIFIVFSCYFYRKFREWKKCNKDIRAHLNSNNNNNNNTDDILYTHGSGMDGLTARTYFGQMPGGSERAAYYQMESPPCYTIATGLPSYDEALLHYHNDHHHQHQHQHHHSHHPHSHSHHKAHQEKQHQNYFNYAFKYMYSTPTAIHQQHQQQQQQEQQQQQQQGERQHMDIVQNVNVHAANNISDENFIRNWKKAPAITSATSTATATATDVDVDVDDKALQYCCTTNNVDRKNNKITSNKKQRIKVSTLLLEQSPPPAYDIAASMALLSDGNDIESTSISVGDERNDNTINICIPDEKLMNRKDIVAAAIEAYEQPNLPEGNNECLNAAPKSNVATIFSHTNEADIDDSLNNIVVIVA